jgi:hypothetical protein
VQQYALSETHRRVDEDDRIDACNDQHADASSGWQLNLPKTKHGNRDDENIEAHGRNGLKQEVVIIAHNTPVLRSPDGRYGRASEHIEKLEGDAPYQDECNQGDDHRFEVFDRLKNSVIEGEHRQLVHCKAGLVEEDEDPKILEVSGPKFWVAIAENNQVTSESMMKLMKGNREVCNDKWLHDGQYT